MASAVYSTNTGTLLNLVAYVNTWAHPEGNYSDVNLRVVLEYSKISKGATSGNQIIIGDYSATYSTPSINQSYSGSHETVLYDETHRVYHNADGRKDARIYAEFAFNGTYSGVRFGTLHIDYYISLDNLDPYGPVITGFSVGSVTQNTVAYYWSANVQCDWAWYSLDGGGSWHDLPNDSIVRGLSPNTGYNFVLSVRKASNQQYTNSGIISAKTLPIYVTSLSIPTSINVDEGKSVSFDVITQPSNASIKNFNAECTGNISVSNNTVKGISKGQGSFVVRATDGSGTSSNRCTVNVIRRVTGISTSVVNAQLEAGSDYKLNCEVLPSTANNTVILYASSDVGICTVSGDGTVHGVEIGSCAITATTADGGYSKEIQIEVTGEIAWIDVGSVPEYVNYWDLNNIYQDQRYIRNSLIKLGASMPNLNIIKCTGLERYITMKSIYSWLLNNFKFIDNGYDHSAFTLEPDYDAYVQWLGILNRLKIDYDYCRIHEANMWTWDDFSFETGIIRDYIDIPVSNSTDVKMTGLSVAVTPTIICTAPMTATISGTTYQLVAGNNTNITIPHGESVIRFASTQPQRLTIKLYQ